MFHFLRVCLYRLAGKLCGWSCLVDGRTALVLVRHSRIKPGMEFNLYIRRGEPALLYYELERPTMLDPIANGDGAFVFRTMSASESRFRKQHRQAVQVIDDEVLVDNALRRLEGEDYGYRDLSSIVARQLVAVR